MKGEQIEYLVYVNWIVLRHQGPALLSVPNDLTELKDSAKHKQGGTSVQFHLIHH